ncbi:hypothetical protein HanIR_Chr03g0114711 [Helianthus annuus]|nr:hypothetical protein HanIR_Chr03g0114711 [Helianthus annuus]
MHKFGDIRIRNIDISRRMLLPLMEREERKRKEEGDVGERMWLNEVAKFDQMKNMPKVGCYGF